MAVNKINVAQQACTEVGLTPIAAFSDETTEAIVLNAHYDTIVENSLSLHYWRFACAQVSLNLLADAPAARWGYAFQIPSTVLLVRAVTVASTTIPYEIYDDKVYCDADGTVDVVLDGVFGVPEEKWPGYFIRYVVLQLSALLASGVREDAGMRTQLDNQVLTQFRLSKNRDSGGRTASKMKTVRITNARLRRGGIG
jgi:hypothetical protein